MGRKKKGKRKKRAKKCKAIGKKKKRKKRKKRKARKAKRVEAPALDPLVEAVISDSQLRSRAVSQVLAETLDAAREQLSTLRDKQRRGVLRVDEARTIPALMSNMKRIVDTMGVTIKIDPDETDEL